MPFDAYTGLGGSGKSHGVVKHVIKPALIAQGKAKKEGKPERKVYTNIPMNADICLEEFGATVEQLDFHKVLEPKWNWLTDVERGSLLVLDECWRIWPAGQTAKGARETDKELVAQHRHMVGTHGKSTEICLVTQDLSQVSMFARQLIDFTYHTRKLSNIGQSDRHNINVYQGSVTGNSPPASKLIKSIKAEKYDPEIFKLYKSHTMSEVDGAGDESKTDLRQNALSGIFPKFLLGIVLLGGFLFYSMFSGEFFGSPVEEVQAASIEPTKLPPELVEHAQRKSPGKDSIFSDLDQIWIEMVTNTSNGFHQYQFTAVTNNNGTTTLDNAILKRLGVRVDTLNTCLARLSSHHESRLVYCRNGSDEKPQNLFGTK